MSEEEEQSSDRFTADGLIDLPYPVVDAAICAQFADPEFSATVKWNRKAQSSGSCSYRWQLGTHKYEMEITALPDEKTYISVTDDQKIRAEFWLRSFHAGIMLSVARRMKTPILSVTSADTPPVLAKRIDRELEPLQRKKRGADQERFNREAREALARGEDRKAVFRRWAKEKHYNLSDPEDSTKADNTFRRMLSRKPKSGNVM